LEASKLTEKTRIIAHALFDGWVSVRGSSVYELGYCNKNRALVDQFKQDVSKAYAAKPSNIRLRKNGTWEITYCSKAILKDLLDIMPTYSTRNMRAHLPARIMKAPEAYSTFLRVFWDDEGTVNYYPQHRTRKLRGPCKPHALRKQLMQMHRFLGIVTREEGSHFITIGGAKNFVKFQKRIGFTRGVHVGLAKYGRSIWAGCEKATLLNLMVKS